MSELSIDTHKFLRKIRTLNNLHQQDMADILSVSLRSYQRYESGDSELGLSQFLRFIRIIDVGGYLDLCQIILKNNFTEIGNNLLKTFKEINDGDPKSANEARVKLHIDDSELKNYSNEYLVGYWDWSPDTDITYWSENMYKIYGVEDREDKRPDNVLQNISEEDRGKIEYGIINLLTKGIPYHNHHVATHSGKKIMINASAVLTKRARERVVVGCCKAYLL